jgi:hypothetical protein
MKHIITALALVASMSAFAQKPPSGYLLLTQSVDGYKVYIKAETVTKVYFIDGTPSLLAKASLWDEHGFYQRVANCETFAMAKVGVDGYGKEVTQDWQISEDGTVARTVARTICGIAYLPSKGNSL